MKEQTMQPDRRPTHTSFTVICPVCGDSPLCPHRAPGCVESLPSVNALRTSNGSSVWIDPTALSSQLIAPPPKTLEKFSDESAQRSSSSEHERVKVSPKYPRSQFLQGNDITRTPTAPQSPMWQYDSPNYQVESSLPSLSLVVSQSPTQSKPVPPVNVTPILAHIDEIDTVPLPNRFASVVDGPSGEKNGRLNSWTAGGAAESPYARRIAERTRHKGTSWWRQTVCLNPLDQLRWWLLRPGRIEFLLWLGGTILLMTLTCVLLLVTALSFTWITPGQQSTTSSLTDPSNAATDVPQTLTAVTTPGLTLMLLDKGPLLPGQSVHLRGQGFTANGHVNFTFDLEHPFLDESGQPLTVQADGQGVFTVTLLPGYPPAWGMGPHIIVAHDLATHHRAAVSLTLASGPFGEKGTATPAPGATDTPTPGNTNLGAVLRWTDGNNWYKAFIDGNNLVIQKKVNGATTILALVPFAATGGTSYTLRFRAIGNTLYARAWQTGTTEPANWMITVADSTLTSGFCGLRVLVQSGAVATITSFKATSL